MKDRLQNFQQLLQANQEDYNDGKLKYDEMLEHDAIFGSDFDEEMEKFLIKVDILHERIKSCKQLTHEMRLKQSEIIVQTGSVTKDDLEEDLECLRKRIKDLTTSVDAEIKELVSCIMKEDIQWSVEHRIRKCQVSALQRMFQDVMFDYNKSQIDHRDNCKKRIVRQLEIAGSEKSDTEVEDMLENKDFTVFSSTIIIETQNMKSALKFIESRHSDIIRLEKSLYELQDLFIELAKTVESQQRFVLLTKDACTMDLGSGKGVIKILTPVPLWLTNETTTIKK